MITQRAGQLAEQKALAYLKEQGFHLVTQNYLCRVGEIDLVMRDGAYFVFIEVRARSNTLYGGGIASINYAKRKKIMKAALHYLMIHKLYEKHPLRFDVISIDGAGNITWLKDAFNADG